METGYWLKATGKRLLAAGGDGEFKIQGFKEKATGYWQLAMGDSRFKDSKKRQLATGSWRF